MAGGYQPETDADIDAAVKAGRRALDYGPRAGPRPPEEWVRVLIGMRPGIALSRARAAS